MELANIVKINFMPVVFAMNKTIDFDLTIVRKVNGLSEDSKILSQKTPVKRVPW